MRADRRRDACEGVKMGCKIGGMGRGDIGANVQMMRKSNTILAVFSDFCPKVEWFCPENDGFWVGFGRKILGQLQDRADCCENATKEVESPESGRGGEGKRARTWSVEGKA